MPKKTFRKKFQPKNRVLKEWKDGSEIYAIVTAALGDCRFIVMCEDKVERQVLLKGSFRNRVRINVEDSVIVSLRVEFDRLSTLTDGKLERGDIIWKYYPKEVGILISNGKINYLKNGVPSSDRPHTFDGNFDNDQVDNEFDELIHGATSNTDEKNKDETQIEIDTDLIDI
jgi:initiation factor 1A